MAASPYREFTIDACRVEACVTVREAADSADEQACTRPVVRGGGMPPPYIKIVRSTPVARGILDALLNPCATRTPQLCSIHYMKNSSSCTRDAEDGVPYGFYRKCLHRRAQWSRPTAFHRIACGAETNPVP